MASPQIETDDADAVLYGSLKCRGKSDRILQMQSYCYSEPPLTELASFDLAVDTPARLIVADEPEAPIIVCRLDNFTTTAVRAKRLRTPSF